MSSANLNTIPNSMVSAENNAASLPQSDQQVPQSDTLPSNQNAIVPKESDKKLDSTRWAHLTKKEAALVKERDAFKKERESFQKEQTEASKYKRAWEMVNEIAELQKTDAIGAMRKAGFSDADMMNFLAQSEDNSTPDEKAAKIVKSEIEKFKDEQAKIAEENNRKTQELQKQQEDRTLAKFKSEIDSYVKKESEKYEYCSFYGEQAQDMIYETISAVLQDSGEMISIDEATQLVEEHYEDVDRAMNSLKKRGGQKMPPADTMQREAPTSRAAAQLPSVNRVESKQFVDNKVPTKTITNKMVPTTSSFTQQELSHEQNKQRIIDKYMSNLRK